MKALRTIAACCLTVVALAAPTSAPAQASGVLPDSPASQSRTGLVTESASPLERVVALDLRDVTLDLALRRIAEAAGVKLVYTDRVVPVERRVTLRADSVSVREALRRALEGTDVEVRRAGEQIVLVRSDRRSAADDTSATGVIFGVVTDSATGLPMTRVVMSVKGTELRVFTNDDGRYLLAEVPQGVQVVTTRMMGYLPAEREVAVVAGERTRVDLALRHTASRLQEVISTATGPQRRLEIGNDITTIDVDSVLLAAPVSTVTELLETRVPGLMALKSTGAPGDPTRLRLRGLGSAYGSNDPIVILDGIRIYAEQTGSRGEGLARKGQNLALGSEGNTDYGNPAMTVAAGVPSALDQIDVSTIETIEVLKGPSAATLYGADAANGVIVITTKKGRPGPARWRATYSQGISTMPGSFADIYRAFGHDLVTGEPRDCRIDDSGCAVDSVGTYQLMNEERYSPIGRGENRSLSLGVNGGSEAVTWALDGSYADEIGLLKLPDQSAADYRGATGREPPSWMRRPLGWKRLNGSARLSMRMNDRANVSLTTTFARSLQERGSLENAVGAISTTYHDPVTNTYRDALSLPRSTLVPDFHRRITAEATSMANGLGGDWRVSPWLSVRGNAGINFSAQHDQLAVERGINISDVNGVDSLGHFNVGDERTLQGTLDLSASVSTPTWRGLRLSTAVGMNLARVSSTAQVSRGTDLVPGQLSLNGAREITVTEARGSSTGYGYYLAPQLAIRGRLFLETAVRYDGGSDYGTGAPKSLMPKLNASWVLSEEPFFAPLSPWIGTLRLRAAYGQSTNNPRISDRLRTYAQRQEWVDGGPVTVAVLGSVGNTQLRPEKVEEIEGGLDADLFENRIMVAVTSYRKTTMDALMQSQLAPSVTDVLPIFRNIGIVRNTGVNVSLTVETLRTDLVTWSSSVNVGYNRNRLLELGHEIESTFQDPTVGKLVEGYPVGGIWERPILGFADENGDGEITRPEIRYGDSLVYMGAPYPNYTMGMSTGLRLLRGMLAIDANFAYEDGLTQNNAHQTRNRYFSRAANDPSVPLADQASRIAAFGASSMGDLETISTLRFNSISVAWQAPPSIAARARARSLSIALQGSNLGLWSDYRGLDPNVNGRAGSSGGTAVDMGVLPTPREWSVRISMGF